MNVHFTDGTITILHGDCRIELADLEPDSIDSCVTDPPYEIGFMGKGHDRTGVAFDPATWQAIYRVLKPGAHLIVFGAPRTWHRVAVAVEDAGFEIRDTILAWANGEGFPKSQNVSKAIDKAAGAEREVVGTKMGLPGYTLSPNADSAVAAFGDGFSTKTAEQRARETAVTAPATAAAEQWDGWGTALKPAIEPILLARKPLIGTVVSNVLAHGTGAMNIDACRIAAGGDNLGGGANTAMTSDTRLCSPFVLHFIEQNRAVAARLGVTLNRPPQVAHTTSARSRRRRSTLGACMRDLDPSEVPDDLRAYFEEVMPGQNGATRVAHSTRS